MEEWTPSHIEVFNYIGHVVDRNVLGRSITTREPQIHAAITSIIVDELNMAYFFKKINDDIRLIPYENEFKWRIESDNYGPPIYICFER